MEMTIKIGGKDVRVKATASLPLKYRAYFGRDLFADLSSIPAGVRDMSKIDTSVFYNVAWCMAKTADDKIPEIEKWVDSGKAMDKAGAYGIQNEFCVFVEKIEGNYNSVVGLPVHMVYDVIKEYVD